MHFKANEKWTRLVILSEPYLEINYQGYAPKVNVVVVTPGTCENYTSSWFINPVSVATSLEPLRIQNHNAFTGIKVWVRKIGGRYAPLEVKEDVGQTECEMDEQSKKVSGAEA